MEKDVDLTASGRKPPPGHEFIGPLDGHGDDRCLAFQRQKEAPSLEGLDSPVPAPRSLGKDKERVLSPFHELDGPGDAPLASPHPLSVNRNEADVAHAHPDDGNAEDLFLEDDPDWPGNEPEEKGAVEKAQVVGHEDVGILAPQPFPTRDFDLEP